MKNIFAFFKGALRGFIFNSFWKSPGVLITLGLSLVINGFLWYIFVSKFQGQNSSHFVFTSTVVVLNFLLANLFWSRERLISQFLIFIAFFVEILILLFTLYIFIA